MYIFKEGTKQMETYHGEVVTIWNPTATMASTLPVVAKPTHDSCGGKTDT
jgi:hypothetical protein